MIWSMFLAPFLSFCNHEMFVRFNLPIFLKHLRQRENDKNTSIFSHLTGI